MSKLTEIDLKTIDGHSSNLGAYAGKVLLLVNVASKCGLTQQYQGLQELYQQKRNHGFEILGFPANDFLEQEPGSEKDIQEFCSLNYQVSFPLFAKISVAGKDKHPLYQALITAQPERIGDGPWRQDLINFGITPNEPPEILWNFEKFLINRQGDVVARFAPDLAADDPRIIAAIDAIL